MSAIVERDGDFLQVIVVHRMLAKVSVIPMFVLYILEKYAWCLVGIGELWSGEFAITFFYENFQDVFNKANWIRPFKRITLEDKFAIAYQSLETQKVIQ